MGMPMRTFCTVSSGTGSGGQDCSSPTFHNTWLHTDQCLVQSKSANVDSLVHYGIGDKNSTTKTKKKVCICSANARTALPCPKNNDVNFNANIKLFIQILRKKNVAVTIHWPLFCPAFIK